MKNSTKKNKKAKNANLGLIVIPYNEDFKQKRVGLNTNLQNRKNSNEKLKILKNNIDINTKDFIKLNKDKVRIKKEKNEKLVNLLKKTKEFLKKPEFDNFERKLILQSNEIFYQSSFASNDVACLYFNVLPIEGPFIIIPCLEKRY